MDRSNSYRRALSSSGFRSLVVALGLGVASVIGVAPAQAQEICGGTIYPFPYTDVASVTAPFCPGIMEAYVTGISKGTSPTTFSPNEDVPRLQMTTFLQRSVDQVLTRASRRAAEEQWWLPRNIDDVQIISLGAKPVLCKPDHDSIWVAVGNTVVRVDASTGAVLGTWTGANSAYGVLVAAGHVFVTGNTSPGVIYVIDPTVPPGPVTTLPTAGAAIGDFPRGIAFDGANIWTANSAGSTSIILLQYPGFSNVSTITGFTQPYGMVFDGSNMWLTDLSLNSLFKLDSSGSILQTVSTGAGPAFPVFDGMNIWVPNANSSSITVVQANTGAVVGTISSELSQPAAAAFDGARILVTNQNLTSVTLFKAADLSLIGKVPVTYAGGGVPYGACSDGLNFWVTDNKNLTLLKL